MKVILSCSYPRSLSIRTHEVLVAAGLIRSIVSEEKALQPEELQTKILEDAGLDLNGPFTDAQLVPGGEYKDLASNILRDNSGDSAFGWADSRTLWLVDFWAGIEEEVCFIFVYSRPDEALAALLKGTEASKEQLEQAFSNWTIYYTELFRSYFQNPGRCLLVHADAIREPSAFIGKAREFFGSTDTNILSVPPKDQREESAIDQVLVRAAIAARGFRTDLYDELESSADLPGIPSSVHDWLQCEQALSQYSALIAREMHASVRQRADQSVLENLASVEARLSSEVLEQRLQTNTWKQRTEDLQSTEAALTLELNEQRARTNTWKQRTEDLQSTEAALTLELNEQRIQTNTWKQRTEDLQSTEAALNLELNEQRIQANTWKQRTGDLQSTGAALNLELNEQRIQTNTWKERTEDLQSTEASLTLELNEQRIQTNTWKERTEDLQSIEAALNLELNEQRIQTSYWKQTADEFDELCRDRGVRLKLFESDASSLSSKLAEHVMRLNTLSAESERLRAEELELRKECELVTQQWLRAEEGLDRQKLLVKEVNDSAAELSAVRDQELEHLRQKIREMENTGAISVAEIAHLQRELECALTQCANLTRDNTQVTSPVSHEVASQLKEITCDFRDHIDGDNWYDAEHDGRWAGPRSVSAVRLTRLDPGEYQFEIEVVDAMDPRFIVDMELLLNGKPIEFARAKGWRRYPVSLKGQFSTSMVPERNFWEFQFAFPGLASPSQNGSEDKRLLAVRVKTLKVVLLQKAGLN